MTLEEQEQAVYQAISRVTREQGLDLVEVKMAWNRKDLLIQVLADKPQGRISLEACTKLNRSIVEVVDKEAILSEDGYSLEVASPGLDRPLVTSKDFLRNMDAEVKIWIKEKIAGKAEYIGIIKEVTEESITLFITKVKQEIVVPVGLIEKGLLVI